MRRAVGPGLDLTPHHLQGLCWHLGQGTLWGAESHRSGGRRHLIGVFSCLPPRRPAQGILTAGGREARGLSDAPDRSSHGLGFARSCSSDFYVGSITNPNPPGGPSLLPNSPCSGQVHFFTGFLGLTLTWTKGKQQATPVHLLDLKPFLDGWVSTQSGNPRFKSRDAHSWLFNSAPGGDTFPFL